MVTSNSINANTTGVVAYNGSGNFTASPVTNHNVLVGGASNSITSVAAGATGTALCGNGASADPSFQTIAGIGSSVTQHYALVGGSSNSITSVSPSTAGFVLTSNGTSADPSFQAPVSSGAVIFLGSQTAATSASITFNSSYFTSTYTHYIFKFDNIDPVPGGTATQLIMSWSTNNGSTYINSGLQSGTMRNAWNSSVWSNTNSTSQFLLIPETIGSNGTCGTINLYSFGPGVISSNYFPSYEGHMMLGNRNILVYGAMLSSFAINNVKFTLDGSNNIRNGVFSLYGVVS